MPVFAVLRPPAYVVKITIEKFMVPTSFGTKTKVNFWVILGFGGKRFKLAFLIGKVTVF